MALVNLPHLSLTGGTVCELSSNSTHDAVLILFFILFFLLTFEMTSGMVLTIQGKVPLS